MAESSSFHFTTTAANRIPEDTLAPLEDFAGTRENCKIFTSKFPNVRLWSQSALRFAPSELTFFREFLSLCTVLVVTIIDGQSANSGKIS